MLNKKGLLSATLGLTLIACGGEIPPSSDPHCVTDRDGDGVLDCEDTTAPPQDLCRFVKGVSANRGCPIVEIEESCVGGGWWAKDMLTSPTNPDELFPSNAFCMYDEKWYFTPISPWHLTGSYRDQGLHGKWVQTDEKTPLYAQATGPFVPDPNYHGIFVSRDKMKWSLKNGQTGEASMYMDGYLFWKYSTILPQDGSLASLEFDSPDYRIDLYTLGGKEVPCTEKNATGGPICHF